MIPFLHTAGFVALGLLNAPGAFATPDAQTDPQCTPPNKVVFITLDGVRWKDFFVPENTPQLHASIGDWIQIGDRKKNSFMFVSNPVNISLPGYQTLFLGYHEGCINNQCDRPQGRTWIEAYVDQNQRCQNFRTDQTAVFGSWRTIDKAVLSRSASDSFPLTMHTGIRPWSDSQHPGDGKIFSELLQSDPPPWKITKKDKYTWLMSDHHWLMHRPNVLYVSLGDTDEWGHRDEFDKYKRALRESDARIAAFMKRLMTSPDEKNTTVIVSTDHGRGYGDEFPNHGPKNAHANEVFALISTPEHRALGRAQGGETAVLPGPFGHAHLRPFIEHLLGIEQKLQGGNTGLLDDLQRRGLTFKD